MSPDGGQIAMIADGALQVRGIELGAEVRVLIDGGLSAAAPAWSPDGRLLAATSWEHPTEPELRVVDTVSGARRSYRLASYGFAFTSADEVVTFVYGSDELEFYHLGPDASRIRSCKVPGDPVAIYGVAVRPTTARLFVRARFADGTTSIVTADRHCRQFRTVVRRVGYQDFALDRGDLGRIRVHRRTASGEQIDVIDDAGRTIGQPVSVEDDYRSLAGVDRDGRLVYLRGNQEWRLTALDHGGQTRELGSGTAPSTFAISPDGKTGAHIEWGLWQSAVLLQPLSDLRNLPKPIDRGLHAIAWSPDGKRLAGIGAEELGAVLVVLDPATRGLPDRIATWREPVDDVVWLDDQHVAVRTTNDKIYRSVDVATGAQGELLDPTPGLAFSLTRSARDGTLAYILYPRQGPCAIWLVRADHAPTRLAIIEPTEGLLAWTSDGTALLAADAEAGRIRRISVPDGRITAMPSIGLGRTEQLRALFPRGDQLIYQTVHATQDLYVKATP